VPEGFGSLEKSSLAMTLIKCKFYYTQPALKGDRFSFLCHYFIEKTFYIHPFRHILKRVSKLAKALGTVPFINFKKLEHSRIQIEFCSTDMYKHAL
jgi:hypothetical protein